MVLEMADSFNKLHNIFTKSLYKEVINFVTFEFFFGVYCFRGGLDRRMREKESLVCSSGESTNLPYV